MAAPEEIELGTFHTTVRVADVAPGSATEIDVGGHRVALFNVDGTFHAVGALCTHRDGPLAEGVLDGSHPHEPIAFITRRGGGPEDVDDYYDFKFSEAGAREVEDLLSRIEHGVLS